jgi:hypothetical protein
LNLLRSRLMWLSIFPLRLTPNGGRAPCLLWVTPGRPGRCYFATAFSSWLVAFHCRKFFAACRLPRHPGLFSFVFRPVGNDRTDELVQKGLAGCSWSVTFAFVQPRLDGLISVMVGDATALRLLRHSRKSTCGHLRAETAKRMRVSCVSNPPANVAASIARDSILSLVCPAARLAVPGIGWGGPLEMGIPPWMQSTDH